MIYHGHFLVLIDRYRMRHSYFVHWIRLPSVHERLAVFLESGCLLVECVFALYTKTFEPRRPLDVSNTSCAVGYILAVRTRTHLDFLSSYPIWSDIS